MKILVIGATGKTGQKLLKALAATEYSVAGLIRKEEQKKLVEQFGATPLAGNIENNVSDLTEGIDAIIFVAGSGGKNIQGVDYQGLVNMVDTAVKAKIKRFLYIGSINTGKEPKQFIKELKEFYRLNNEATPEALLVNTQKTAYHNYVKVKEMAESHIINSDLNYTILRAGLLTQEQGSGAITVTEGTLNAFGKTSRENIATAFITALENKSTYRKIYTVIDGDTLIADAFI